MGSVAGERRFLALPYHSQRTVFASLWALFHCTCWGIIRILSQLQASAAAAAGKFDMLAVVSVSNLLCPSSCMSATWWLHCTLAAAQCIVIGLVCGCVFVCVCLWVSYHDNSKFHASILTKFGLLVKVVTISSWYKFWLSAPPGRGSVVGMVWYGILGFNVPLDTV